MMRKNTRLKPLDLYEAMENGARSALGVASACACSGLNIGVVTLTGLGLKSPMASSIWPEGFSF
jgi:TRAP-type uncharacterized transport system fused permease subunit